MERDRLLRSRRGFLGALGGTVAAGLAGCAASRTRGRGSGTDSGAGVGGGTDATAPQYTAVPDESPFTEVYRESIDAVVLVRVFTAAGGGQGSGFFVDGEHVVTNEHVVGDAERIEVRHSRGDWREGEVVGTDAYSDLAVVRVDSPPAYTDELAFVEEEPPIGRQVVVIGNPFGLGGSVSTGIVSGVDRSLEAPNNFPIADTVQTDAAVNPGNSGGPMLTLDGAVVSVVSAGGGENIGFGISAALAKRVVPELIATGEYRHSFVGISTVPVTPLVAEVNGLGIVEGVLVADVRSGTPAEGVLRGSTDETVRQGRPIPVGGDVIVAVDDTPVVTQSAFSTYLALNTSPGDTVEMTVVRDGQRQTVELTLASRPDPRIVPPAGGQALR
jgi:S1-C subfamily serine protease